MIQTLSLTRDLPLRLGCFKTIYARFNCTQGSSCVSGGVSILCTKLKWAVVIWMRERFSVVEAPRWSEWWVNLNLKGISKEESENLNIKKRSVSRDRLERGRRESGVGVSSKRSSEEKNEGLGFVDFVVDPASGLLNTKTSPFAFREESSSGDLLVDGFREEDMTVLIDLVVVLLRVLDFVRVVRHKRVFFLISNIDLNLR